MAQTRTNSRRSGGQEHDAELLLEQSYRLADRTPQRHPSRLPEGGVAFGGAVSGRNGVSGWAH